VKLCQNIVAGMLQFKTPVKSCFATYLQQYSIIIRKYINLALVKK